jgi:hypothetical protein
MTEPLIDQYHSFMVETWDDGIPLGMILKDDGSIIMVALALEPEQAYEVFLSMVVEEKAAEAVFALDRFTKPGQGTKYNDVLAGHYFDRSLGKSPWRPFVIEYQTEPRHFDPVDWDNTFWNTSLIRELAATMRRMIMKMERSLA